MVDVYRDEFKSLPDFLAAVVMAAPDGYDVRDQRLVWAAATGFAARSAPHAPRP